MKKILKGITSYFNGVKKEFGRIKWTNKKDLFKYSVATLSFMLFFGVFFYLVDLIIAFIRSNI